MISFKKVVETLWFFLQLFKAMAFGAAMASFDCTKLQSALVTARCGNHCM